MNDNHKLTRATHKISQFSRLMHGERTDGEQDGAYEESQPLAREIFQHAHAESDSDQSARQNQKHEPGVGLFSTSSGADDRCDT